MKIPRRDFLGGLAGLSGAALLRSSPAAAQPQPSQATRKHSKPVIDAHFHWYPPEFVDLIEKEGEAKGVRDNARNENGELEATVPGYHPYAPRARFRHEMSDIESMLTRMDERGVDMCTLTQTNPQLPRSG